MTLRLLVLLAFLFCGLPVAVFAQFITRGPVVGGVTQNSARIYLQTDGLKTFELQIARDSLFAAIDQTLTDSTRADRYNTRIVDISGLQPFTQYYYRFRFGGATDSLRGYFYTFPQAGQNVTLRVVVGSCNYYDNFPIFESIRQFQPHLFLHLGDWNYPPSSPGQGANYNLFPAKRASSFAIRYNDANMKRYVFPYGAVDFIYDDDWSQNGVQGVTWPNNYTTPKAGGGLNNHFDTQYMDSANRVGAIRAYFDYFPGYPAVDTAWGIFHRIPAGLADFFVTDVRTSSMPQNEAYFYDSTNTELPWRFDPESLGDKHTLLGPVQRNWLLNGLNAAQDRWRITASGVVFNRRYREFIDFLMSAQNLELNGIAGQQGTAGLMSASLAYNWAAYPVDHKPLLDLAQSAQGRNMLFLSGDSHSSAIDDGANAGMPEMMASGLAAGDEGTLNYYINQMTQVFLQKTVKQYLWNQGGSGVDNENFADTYTTMEIFGRDSMRLSVVDELAQTLGVYVMKWKDGTDTTVSRAETFAHNRLITVAFPNPAKDQIRIDLADRYRKNAADYCLLLSPNGQEISRLSAANFGERSFVVDLRGLSAGVYLLRFVSQQGTENRQVLVRNE